MAGNSILVINAAGAETRVALVESGNIHEYYLERKREKGIVGNIYKGRVVRVLPGMQAAFVEHDAQQCGFCTPGFVMACKALLDKNPNPTTEQIRDGLGGNLCRCGTYAGIRQVVMTAGRAAKGGNPNG